MPSAKPGAKLKVTYKRINIFFIIYNDSMLPWFLPLYFKLCHNGIMASIHTKLYAHVQIY